MNDLFWTFTITEAMRAWTEKNREKIEAKYLDDMRYIGVDFCETFDTNWNFEIRWPEYEQTLMYVASVWIWYSVIIDWDIRRNTVEEFLWYIEDLENQIIELEKSLKK